MFLFISWFRITDENSMYQMYYRLLLDYSEACEQHSSVSEVMEEGGTSTRLSLADCLAHYTRAETLAMEDAWR